MKKKQEQSVQVVDPKLITQAVEQAMPEWVAKIHSTEDAANAILASAQEMWLAIADTLLRYHDFSEQELAVFHSHMKDILTGAKEFEQSGLSMLSPHSMGIVGDKIQEVGIEGLLTEIAQIRYNKERVNRIGLVNPLMPEAKPFLKKLRQKNNGR